MVFYWKSVIIASEKSMNTKNFLPPAKGAIAPQRQARGSCVYKCTLSKFARKLESPAAET
jgi:hypothetical protein